MKLARGARLVIASHNPGKVFEIEALLQPFGLDIVGAGSLGLVEPEETGATFAENALLKAVSAAESSGAVSLADDSGLAVDALAGAPGIYSARWAGPEKDFSTAIARVERELGRLATGNVAAKFVCALAISAPDGAHLVFQGEIAGRLVFPPRGTLGFGYDPIFVAEGMQQTFGEMPPDTKHAISHRARAFEKLVSSGIFPR